MRLFILALFLSICVPALAQKLQVADAVTEHQKNPIGIEGTSPRFSWKLVSQQRDVLQTSYELRVGDDPSISKGNKVLWQTGKVQSDQSVLVPYAGQPLQAKKRYYWQVRVSDNKSNTSAWSDVQFFEMGMPNCPVSKSNYFIGKVGTMPHCTDPEAATLGHALKIKE